MNASFTVEICKKKNYINVTTVYAFFSLLKRHKTINAKKVCKDKEEVVIPSKGPHLELSTFKDTKFSSWRLLYLIVYACCELMLDQVLEMFFSAFLLFFFLLLINVY